MFTVAAPVAPPLQAMLVCEAGVNEIVGTALTVTVDPVVTNVLSVVERTLKV